MLPLQKEQQKQTNQQTNKPPKRTKGSLRGIKCGDYGGYKG